MIQKQKYTIMVFYSNINQVSLQTRITINKFIDSHPYATDITTKEIDYEKNRILSQEYGIMGTPAILFMKNDNLVKRIFGEITSEEFSVIFEELINIKK